MGLARTSVGSRGQPHRTSKRLGKSRKEQVSLERIGFSPIILTKFVKIALAL